MPEETATPVDNDIFLLPESRFDTFFQSLEDAIPGLPSPLQSIGRAAIHNLDAVVSITSMPGMLAYVGVWERDFATHHLTAYVRATDEQASGTIAPNQFQERAVQIVREMLDSYSQSEPSEHRRRKALKFLSNAVLAWTPLSRAAPELLRQALVLAWGALEVAARDMFIEILNARPSLAIALLCDPRTRKLFQLKGLDLETLAEHGFDVSKSMGSILAQQHEVGNLPAIREVFSVLYPDSAQLHEVLGSETLWLLSHRRHLIVHRRGVVDSRYLSSTADNQTIGSELRVTPAVVLEAVEAVRDVVVSLLKLEAVSV